MQKKWKWTLGVAAVVVVGVVGGPFVYIHFVEGPAPKALTLAADPSASAAAPVAASGDDTGTWTVGSGSQAGYRVKETLFGQSTTAVGRTSAITGSVTLDGKSVTAASFSVDMTKVTSDQSGRDGQFQGRIMDTADYPKATFTLASPITLPASPGGTVETVDGTGTLTLHGTSKQITAALQVQRTGAGVEVLTDIPVTFADYHIDNPSGGPASVGDSGTLEVLLTLTKAA